MQTAHKILHQLVTPYFLEQVEHRGQAYFLDGRVRIEDGDEGFVDAVVRGTQSYIVELYLDNNVLTVSCTCPYAAENDDPCKHAYATLLAGEQSGYLTDFDRSRPLSVVVEDPLGDLEIPAFEDEGGVAPAAFRPPARDDWRQRVMAVRLAMERGHGGPLAEWRSGREILYVVTRGETGETGLEVNLCYRERKKNGDWGTIKPFRVTTAVIDRLGEPEDRRIISTLLGAGENELSGYVPGYRYYGYSPRFAGLRAERDTFILSASLEQMVLPAMARTGRLRYRREKGGKRPPAGALGRGRALAVCRGVHARYPG